MILLKEQWYFMASAITNRFIRTIKRESEPKSILVIKLDEIGDMVYAIPVFAQLKERFPQSEITLWCKPFVKPLVQNNSAIDHFIHQTPDNIKFDLIVELRGNWETLKYALSHMPKRRLDRGEVRIKNKLKGEQKHEWITNFEIIKPLLASGSKPLWPEIVVDDTTKTDVDLFLQQNNLTNYAVLHCGARRKLRQWSSRNFAALANTLFTKYKLTPVFAGTEEDEGVIDEIIKLGHLDAVKCLKDFSLVHFAELTRRSKLFVGNESGPLHIATVMKIPVVGIYGPGIKDIFYPIGEQSRVVHHVLECNPCDQIHCVRPDSPCIDLATLAEVEGMVEELLGEE